MTPVHVTGFQVRWPGVGAQLQAQLFLSFSGMTDKAAPQTGLLDGVEPPTAPQRTVCCKPGFMDHSLSRFQLAWVPGASVVSPAGN